MKVFNIITNVIVIILLALLVYFCFSICSQSKEIKSTVDQIQHAANQYNEWVQEVMSISAGKQKQQ